MADKISSTAAYTASGSAIIFGLSANELAAMIGAVIAVLTFILNFWFKYQHLNLAKSQSVIDQLAREGKIERRSVERQ